MSPTPGPRRAPAAATRPAVVPPSWPAAPSSWSARNPVDDDTDPTVELGDPAPPRRARRATRPAAAPAAAGKPAAVRPATRRPGPAAAEPAVGLGAARTEQTGKPRVDWKAYDAQLYDTPPEWVLYRAWTRLPIDGRWWARWWAGLLAFLLGGRCELLWVGISMRSGVARWTEHLADKSWRRLVHVFEIDPDVSFATEAEAEAYEDLRIAAECPRYNRKSNERAYNPGATHLTKRIKAYHLADWHHQAGQLSLLWLAAAALCAWLLWPDTMPADLAGRLDAGFQAIVAGVAGGAVMLMFGRIMRLAILGAQPTTVQRQRIAARGARRTRRR